MLLLLCATDASAYGGCHLLLRERRHFTPEHGAATLDAVKAVEGSATVARGGPSVRRRDCRASCGRCPASRPTGFCEERAPFSPFEQGVKRRTRPEAPTVALFVTSQAA